MSRKKKGGLIRDLTVGEDFRIGVNLAMKKFRNSEDDKGKKSEHGQCQSECVCFVILFKMSESRNVIYERPPS